MAYMVSSILLRLQYLEVRANVRRVGHAKPQHGAFGQLGHNPLQHFWQRAANVSSVRACIFTGHPYLLHALLRD